jgi:hypothetical protein
MAGCYLRKARAKLSALPYTFRLRGMLYRDDILCSHGMSLFPKLIHVLGSHYHAHVCLIQAREARATATFATGNPASHALLEDMGTGVGGGQQ